jgi:exonuclease SbcD
MRVLFSTDWHLGYEMGGANRVDRLPDQLRQLRLIARYIEEHNVDVLAVAGDVFEAQERGRARLTVQSMMEVLQPALDQGLSLVMIAGNHDRDYFMDTANAWLGAVTEDASRRIVLATRPEVVPVEAKGERVNFVLLPFPTPSRYQMPELVYDGGKGARNESIAKHFIETMEALRQQAAADRAPTILMTHVTLEATDVGPHRISPHDDVVIPCSAFPSFEMTVVGHIHKAERFGSGHFYYAGVLDRMDIGEIAYQPQVLLADIGATDVNVTPLPLDPTPFAEVLAETEADLERQHDTMERPELTLVKLRLKVPYGSYTAPLIARAHELFPRLYGNVEHEWLGAPAVTPSVGDLDPRNVSAAIERYLEEQVPDATERAELLQLVGELRAATEATA